MKILLIILCVFAILLLLGWLGLQVKPRAFEPYAETAWM
jgi:hypothetical protein